MTSKTQIAIFCSGAGSNAREIMDYFKAHPSIQVKLLAANKPDAGALRIAQAFSVDTLVFDKHTFKKETEAFCDLLKQKDIDFIILAGFLWQIPEQMVAAFPERILNIHPALLPKFGGKGMYGHFVHEAVLTAGEQQSGMTVHLVNPVYDDGKILFQAYCPVLPTDDAATLAARVLRLEHAYFASVIEAYIQMYKSRIKYQ
jgi:phosphoribosylglycinamide formyltransferase-1